MIPVVLFGAGGHAKVVLDACAAQGAHRPVACLGDSRHADLLGVPVHPESAVDEFVRQGVRHAFVAIGSNTVRERVAQRAEELGFELVTIVSPRACVSPHAVLGSGTVVMAGAVVQPGARVGRLGIVNTNATVDHDCLIGDAVHVAPGSTLCGSVIVGARTWIGAGATVIDGLSVADDVFVGAGAAVVRDIAEAGVLVRGVPARVASRSVR